MSGYYDIGEQVVDSQIITARWKDNTNRAVKHHVVRPAIGTVREVEYTHAAGDLPIGVIQTAGTYNEDITVITEGIALCINSLAGTISIGDPVVVDYGNSGGTVGKVMSGVQTGSFPDINGTTTGSGTDLIVLPLAYPVKPGSIRMDGTATQSGSILGEGSDGTNISANGPLLGGDFTCLINQPIIGIALDSANSPNDELRVKLARQNDIKNASTY